MNTALATDHRVLKLATFLNCFSAPSLFFSRAKVESFWDVRWGTKLKSWLIWTPSIFSTFVDNMTGDTENLPILVVFGVMIETADRS